MADYPIASTAVKTYDSDVNSVLSYSDVLSMISRVVGDSVEDNCGIIAGNLVGVGLARKGRVCPRFAA